MASENHSDIGDSPQETPQYLLCVRGSKSKLYAVAGVTLGEQSCLRAAEINFEKAGFDTRKMSTKWGCTLTAQKNFAGYVPEYKSIVI